MKHETYIRNVMNLGQRGVTYYWACENCKRHGYRTADRAQALRGSKRHERETEKTQVATESKQK